MPRVNIIKQIKDNKRWKIVSIPRDRKGHYNWKNLPDGRYFIEWYEAGKRRRQAAGATVSQAKETARRKGHDLEGRALGIARNSNNDQESLRIPLHIAVKRYLSLIEGLRKPGTLVKYQSVLKRFLEFFSEETTAQSISVDDLNEFVVFLKKDEGLGNNSVIDNIIVVAQFLKKQGRPGLMREIDLPQKIIKLPREYSDEELKGFFSSCNSWERALFSTFLLTGFRSQEMSYLFWDDINFKLNTIQVRAKPDLGFYPKHWEEREVPAHKGLIELLRKHPHIEGVWFVFPSVRNNRNVRMLNKCKALADKAGLNPGNFTLHKFRSTYATRMLRAGFDVRTVQHWMGHKSLETTMRYLAPAKDVHAKLDQVDIAGVLGEGSLAIEEDDQNW